MFIIHLGSSGFPLGNAQIQRIRLTFKGLKLAGCNPLIINKYSVHKNENTRKINRFQGIPFISTSVLSKRPNNFFIRNLNKFSGFIGELILLVKKRKGIHSAIFYSSSFGELIYYRILSKVLGFKIIIQYVEFRSSIENGNKLLKRINNKLFDNYCFYFCDGIIVISEFLRNHTISKKQFLPLIKIPAICDFEEFNLNNEIIADNYLMYCGTIVYLQVIEFVLELFCRLKIENIYNGNLLLAIGGDIKNPDVKRLEDKIIHSGYSNNVIMKLNVPYLDLIPLYKKAELLIVPLRNTFQDIAGFHHKVGEYSATKRPIISTNFGELQYYFKDGVSAILADEYSIDSYIEKLNNYLFSKENLAQIGKEGYNVGQEKLNYKTYSNELKHFIMDSDIAK